MPESAWNGAVGLWVCSAVAAVLSVLLVARTLWFLSMGRRARGEVTAIERDSGEFPIVTFQPEAGRDDVSFRGWSTPKSWSVGEKVDVLYDPARPETARIATFAQLWAAPIVVLCVSIVLAGLGALFAFTSSAL